jgi:hypothetical protein
MGAAVPNPLVIQKPELPASINPQGASVFDAPGQGILRKMVSLLGLDDPQQVMGVGAAMDVGPMGGGLIDAVAQRFPRFAAAIKAYHGSPHDFEAFDTSKIGTGEGAQAYGHGLYFAENPTVAQEYKKALTDFEVHEPSGRIIGSGGPKQTYKGTIEDRALAWVQDAASRNDIADPFQFAIGNARRGLSDDANGQAIVDQIKKWQDAGAVIKPGGRMYEVAINAYPDQFLDWDKPLSQQSPEVQQRLERTGLLPDLQRYASANAARYPNGPAGATLHDMARYSGYSSQEIADKLNNAGIPGIKYLDQGSRAAGEGSRNFVVFDAKTIDILKKYGLLPPAVSATIAAQQSQAQPNGSGQ